MVAVETLHRFEQLVELAPEWHELCRADPSATPFQSPSWALAWWRHMGRGKLHCVTLRRDGVLVGLAPLYVSQRQFPPLRRLAFLGTGRSDYLDALIHPNAPEDCLPHLFDALWQARGEWDYLDFQQAGPLSHVMGASELRPKSFTVHDHSRCPYLPFEGADGMALVPPKQRKNLRYSLGRLTRSGAVRFRVTTADTLDSDLRELFRLHRSRWRSRGLPGVFGSTQVQALHREAAADFLERDWLRLHILERGATVLSAALCYVMNGRTLYYGGGFEPEAAAFSPGSLVVAEAIRHAAAEGCTEFDFLRGEEAYKRLWGCRTRPNQRLVAARNPAASQLVRRLPSLETGLERAGMKMLERYQRLRSNPSG